MNEFTSGSVEGTGSAINVSLGFQPSYVKVWNIDADVPACIEWAHGPDADGDDVTMGAAGGWKQVNSTDVLYTLAIDNGTRDNHTLVPGDLIQEHNAGTDVATDANAVFVYQPAASSGTWAGDDWLGNLIVKDFSGTAFTENHKLLVGSDQIGLVAAAGEVIYDGSLGIMPEESIDVLSSLGISVYAGSSASAALGFTIGADTDVNVSGDTLLYIAMR